MQTSSFEKTFESNLPKCLEEIEVVLKKKLLRSAIIIVWKENRFLAASVVLSLLAYCKIGRDCEF